VAKPLVEDFFSQYLNLPQPEKLYSITWNEPHTFSEYTSRHNLMVISLVNPADETGDRLFEKIHNGLNTTDSVIAVDNLYRQNQLFVGIHSFDAYQLNQQLTKYKDWIFDELSRTAHATLTANSRSHGSNRSLEDHVADKFGIEIFIQDDYKTLQEVEAPSFLWIGRGYPFRWITFHDVDISDIKSPDSTWIILEVLLESTIGSIEITNDYRDSELINNDGDIIPLLRGNYFHPESDSGGPFFSMFFKKPDSGYLIISGFVNNPGHEKMGLIKQLESIIRDTHFIVADNG